MGSKSALFLIQTPLHVQNAKEAILSFGIVKPVFLVVLSRHNKKWAEMISDTLPSEAKSLVTTRDDNDIEACTKDYMRHVPWLVAQSFDMVFFSDTKLYIFVDLVNLLQNDNTYLMDDGTNSLQSVYILNKYGLYFEKSKSSCPSRSVEIEKVKRKYGIWDLKPTTYNLFTAFDVDPTDKLNVVRNSMTWCCKEHENLNESSVLILGQPFIEANYLGKAVYQKYLALYVQRFPNKKIHYFAHPREDDDNVIELCANANMQRVSSRLSAEQYLKELSCAPAHIGGFYSTALWNLAKFQPAFNVTAMRIEKRDFNDSIVNKLARSNYMTAFDNIELIYRYLEKVIPVFDSTLGTQCTSQVI